MLCALVLSALALESASVASPGDPTPPVSAQPVTAHVRVLAGHATIHAPAGPHVARAGQRPASVDGGAVAALGRGSVALVTWPGQASIRLTGPAELEWLPPWTDGTHLTWRVRAAAGLEAEVRRGPVEVDLLQGWTLSAGAGAFRISPLSAGAFRVRNHAGTPLRVSRPGAGSAPPQRWLVPQGQSLRLKATH